MKICVRQRWIIFEIPNGEAIKIEEKGSANTLFIQKIEDNTDTEEMTRFVRENGKVQNVLSMVEGLKVKEMKKENFLDEMKSQNSYTFGFSKEEKFKTTGKPMPYAFYILEDGTFAFPYASALSVFTLRKLVFLASKETTGLIK